MWASSNTWKSQLNKGLYRPGALGIKLDAEANKVRGDEPRLISTEDSAIPVLVVPTNEEKAIAEATEALVA